MHRSVSQLQAYSEVSELTTLPVTPPPLQSLESSAASREGELKTEPILLQERHVLATFQWRLVKPTC